MMSRREFLKLGAGVWLALGLPSMFRPKQLPTVYHEGITFDGPLVIMPSTHTVYRNCTFLDQVTVIRSPMDMGNVLIDYCYFEVRASNSPALLIKPYSGKYGHVFLTNSTINRLPITPTTWGEE